MAAILVLLQFIPLGEMQPRGQDHTGSGHGTEPGVKAANYAFKCLSPGLAAGLKLPHAGVVGMIGPHQTLGSSLYAPDPVRSDSS